MAYLVLARKWRPPDFDGIVGQEHVTRALQNAIRLDRVAHAFLFCGARGVGKTSAARVLSCALQCESGPTETPCGTCSACTEIASGSCVDVFEIDGASNRGINEIRELRDGVAYAPARDRFKIYIIDEVHMLTQEAFNALLKTLEEPPRHVKFIFATTEPQKIPVTILSRCQRYDFKRVPLRQVKAHLDDILAREGVHIAEEGVRMIARESEGSIRDALSMLDRVISFAGEEADAKAVADCLGVADRKWLYRALRSVLDGEPAAALEVIGDVHHYGYDIRAFTSDLLATVRDLVVVKVCGPEARVGELSDAEARAFAAMTEGIGLPGLQRVFRILLSAADEVATTRHPRLVLEMAVIRAASARELMAVPHLLERLEALEHRLAGNQPPGPPVAGRGGTSAEPAQRQGAQSEGHSRAARPKETARPSTATPAPTSEVETPTAARRLEPAAWPDVVQFVRQSEPLLASMLENAAVREAGGDRLTLGVANEFYYSQLVAARNRERLAELLNAYFGSAVEVQVVAITDGDGTLAAELAAKRAREQEERKKRVVEHPLTRAAMEATGGRVADVRIEEVRDE